MRSKLELDAKLTEIINKYWKMWTQHTGRECDALFIRGKIDGLKVARSELRHMVINDKCASCGHSLEHTVYLTGGELFCDITCWKALISDLHEEATNDHSCCCHACMHPQKGLKCLSDK